MRATGIAATAFPAAAPVSVRAPASALAACRPDGSEHEQVASAFVSAAIRLGHDLPTESAERQPSIDLDRPPYIGRHRRTRIVRLGADLQVAQS